MFIAALLTIAKKWKQVKCPLMDEWINQMWYIYSVEYYSAFKRKEILTCYNMDESWIHYIQWNSFPGGTSGQDCHWHQRRKHETGVQSPGQEDSMQKETATHSCPENFMDRGTWQATVHKVTQSWTCLKPWSMHAHMHVYFVGLQRVGQNWVTNTHTHICYLVFEDIHYHV